jgi:divalent metal cation (Fe/Co/Zn/Cd) transporter
MDRGFPSAPNEPPAGSEPCCCSRLRPTSSQEPPGACGPRHGEAFSLPGLIVALLAMPIMTLLARRKIAIATQLGSRAMRADAAESITCGWLSFVVVVGLLADLMLGAWWVDAVTSLVIVGFVVKEAREAWSGEDCCDHD